MARETVTIEGLDKLLDRLRRLGPEAGKRGGPVRRAARRGALVISNQAKANVARIVATPNVGGQDNSTGMLEKSIRPMRGRPNRNGIKGETFLVTVPRRARYPVDKRTPTGVSVATVGKMLEYGTSKRRPYPWMGPAFHAKKGEAVQVMTDELLKGIKALEKKLGSGQ